jgi:hypothetical protein
MTPVMLLGYGLATYAGLGVCTALAFVTAGIDRVLAQPASFTLPARLLLLPGAVALWPYVLVRWLKARSQP